jgi:large subunit ribosomal protein L10
MKKEDKAKIVEELAGQIAAAEAIYAVDYRGLSVTQAARLRASLRETDSSFRIVKNTLTLRAADQSGGDTGSHVKTLLEGPTALTFVQGDPALAAKALDAFARAERLLELRGGVLGGRPMSAEEVRTIARLPARDQLNAQFAGIVASPLTGLVRGLGSLLSGLAVALGAVRDKKLAEAPDEAAAAEPTEAATPSEPEEAEPAEEAKAAAPGEQAEAGQEPEDGAGGETPDTEAQTDEDGGSAPAGQDQQSEASEEEAQK